MPDQSIVLRVAAKDDGVRAVMKQIADGVDDTFKRIRASGDAIGPIKPPRFEFDERLIRGQQARLIKKLREDAEREKIRLQAEIVVKTARDRAGIADSQTPTIDRRAFQIAGRTALEQSRRDRIARNKRDERSGETDEEGGSGGSGLDDLRDTFGRGGKFTQLARLVQGAGPILGIGLAAREVGNISDAVVKLRDGLNDSSKSASDLVEEFAKSIPVVGDLWKIESNIYELFNGDKARLAEINAEAESTNRAIAAEREIIKETNEHHQETLVTVRKIREEIERLHASPSDLPFLTINQQQQDAIEAAKNRRDEAQKAVNEEAAAALNKGDNDSVKHRLESAQQAVADLKQTISDDRVVRGAHASKESAEAALPDAQARLASAKIDAQQIEATRKQAYESAEDDYRKTVEEQGKLTADAVQKADRELAEARANRTRESAVDTTEAIRQAGEINVKATAETAEATMEREGNVYSAKLARIAEQRREGVEQALADLDAAKQKIHRDYDEKVKNDPSQEPTIRKETIAALDAADHKKFAAVKSVDHTANDQRRAAEQDESLDKAKAQEQSNDRIRDLQVSTAEERLKLSGNLIAAEKLQRDAAFGKELQDLKDNYVEQLRLHKEREPELKKQLAANEDALKGKYDADSASAAAAEDAKSRVKGPAPFSGESRLLTGVGSSIDPLVAPAVETAKNTSDALAVNKSLLEIQKSLLLAINMFINAQPGQPPATAGSN